MYPCERNKESGGPRTRGGATLGPGGAMAPPLDELAPPLVGPAHGLVWGPEGPKPGARPALTFWGGFSPWTIIPFLKEKFLNSKISQKIAFLRHEMPT